MASELTVQDLDVEELNVTSAVLMAGAQHYGVQCKEKNDNFMRCRTELKDPRKCLTEGKEVTKCAFEFFRKVKGACNEAFTEHWTCLDFNNQDYSLCRKTQATFDGCMSEKLNMKKPDVKK
ncbi:PREDICTED: NADH dehydrogenase [ubiquinone] 1 alpha subcomplex subunit 8-like [Amphimedon queenslandica]|uniref:NADH dehydrogenase [ubiquinone] 1 alpha subcomplex subunit 8 n=1 Tax=Amphimedon queenslandica TaxID=400682 RepID=A0A1X7VBY4_AMPQE|nr:PREDICTED: NADH dehydrogenase [ubiquinone] 1 alpha subcomplex subunit 8-like [Amphimedon queenslandica]|eukprot:XP_003384823.1 PREDICTED: NADH dehydrogenase [ubiquinone] 1 alpha subcomplex subunit 8-like [Amphimedon queenslandica]